ncbi:hypothetical protein EFK50_03620 [Nocardioides marmoriginsengisoli]|uniref:Cholesterol esterase n=1 Tax=Nocardioides marmoriginsengisoli TaxID=661483 RepID=A0A3N0CNR0_9ACTN|nr:DUF6230 family protein [Nocardioides marmoriginsengisoli]RNL65075.1 hypothetical protein EFK50_03620 [Nocardioides marmoriginsengisoli]
MSAVAADGLPRYGTRWRRTGVLLGAGLAVVVALVALVRTSVIASSIVVQNASASFSSSAIVGQDVGLGVVPILRSNGSTGSVLRAGFATVSLNGFCLSKTETIAGFTYTITLSAGDGNLATNEITANNAVFDLSSMRSAGQAGQATNGLVLQGIDQLGLAATDVTTTRTGGVFDANPLEASTSGYGKGAFGIDATSGSLSSVKGTLWDAQVNGSINLPNLKIAVTPGTGTACSAAGSAYPK